MPSARKPKFYSDSDGLYADFNLQLYRMHGVWPHQIDDGDMWKLIHSDFRFWVDMPVVEGSREMWDAIKHLNPPILTGCHRDNYEAIAAEKIVWWKKNFDHDNVITCLSRNKALHMEQAGDILHDDTPRILKKWEKAGGVGVLHRQGHHAESIRALRELGVI